MGMAIIWVGHLYLAEGQGALQHCMPPTDHWHVWASSSEANLFCLAPSPMAGRRIQNQVAATWPIGHEIHV
jgi:hypothetical protein